MHEKAFTLANMRYHLSQLKRYSSFHEESDDGLAMDYYGVTVTGNGDSCSDFLNHIVSLMKWVNQSTSHNGERSGDVDYMNADYLLSPCEMVDGLTCLMIAVVFQEMCMRQGILCHIIQMKSSDPMLLTSHWVTEIYIPGYKWAMFDPTYCVFCTINCMPLSLKEIRDSIISNIKYEVELSREDLITENEYRGLLIVNCFQFDVFKINSENTFFHPSQSRINISPVGYDGADYRLKRFQEERKQCSPKELMIMKQQIEIMRYSHAIDFVYRIPDMGWKLVH